MTLLLQLGLILVYGFLFGLGFHLANKVIK
jgi:high-affinity nickel permease